MLADPPEYTASKQCPHPQPCPRSHLNSPPSPPRACVYPNSRWLTRQIWNASSALGTEVNNGQFKHKVISAISQSQPALCWNLIKSKGELNVMIVWKFNDLTVHTAVPFYEKRSPIQCPKVTFLSLFDVPPSFSLGIWIFSKKRNFFRGVFPLHNFGHFKPLLPGSCGCWTLNWIWTSALQVAQRSCRKGHMAVKGKSFAMSNYLRVEIPNSEV